MYQNFSDGLKTKGIIFSSSLYRERSSCGLESQLKVKHSFLPDLSIYTRPSTVSLSTVMKIFLAFALLASVSADAEWNALKVTYGQDGAGYYDLPWSVKEATAQKKWVKLDDDKEINVEVYSQPGDPRVMLLFDKKGTIAGIRVGFLKEDVTSKARAGGYPFEFDYDASLMYQKGNYFGKDLWHVTVLLASPKTLAAGGRAPLVKATQEVAEGLYFKDEGKWTEVSRDECQASADFTEGNCFPGMGKHYFYKLGEKDDCSHRQPFFKLYNQGRLHGVGVSGYGGFSEDPKTQSYFEDFPTNAAKSIMPNGPKCVEEYIKKYGLTMMHIYLKKDAAKLDCPAKDWRSAHC